ncbi:hypothetical protein ACP70R_048427 [Stipagrostis hirtigluma subsp. patula]
MWATMLVTSKWGVQPEHTITSPSQLLTMRRIFLAEVGWVIELDTASSCTFLWRPEDGDQIALPAMDKNMPKNCKCLLSDERGGAASCVMMVLDLDEFVAGPVRLVETSGNTTATH